MQVSVVMSVFNARRYLNEAVNSILEQTFKEFEFIIIDDGSTDGSVQILEDYALADKRIVLIKNERNLGLPTSLNRGILLAKGKYIARQDADDVSGICRLKKQLHYAQLNPDIDIIGSDCYIIDLNSELVCKTTHHSKITDFKSTLLNRKAIFPHGSALIKRDKIIAAGLYDTRFYYSQDGELWLRMISKGSKIKVLQEPLYYFRMLPVTNNKKNEGQAAYNKIKQLIYLHKADNETIDQETIRIKNTLAAYNSSANVLPNYMAVYWRGLANTAYFNQNVKKGIPFKYLYRAFREKNNLKDYLNYFKLVLLYIFPAKPIRYLLSKR